ncbi:DUF397 domain-containing protein [Streptomyces sp. NBC_01317]|uniref:DUF397 domain-containing protein n=1 Tax=Streptomyces sp. NBC_01317 TaxID=2903822 RepID=UPI002E119D8D|nr:DUF397 domain-containing protein [Streptomyces sp. NBC_01317]
MRERLMWFKSSYSDGEGGNCVEVAGCDSIVHVRDSKVSGGPEVGFSAGTWVAFVAYAIHAGRPGA